MAPRSWPIAGGLQPVADHVADHQHDRTAVERQHVEEVAAHLQVVLGGDVAAGDLDADHVTPRRLEQTALEDEGDVVLDA